eukprot:TRINITY_DN3068_c0_g1_i1.p2 TRINITY_DN3068_c0_g1~~TRINITY_DN3068_c0_g1_i1.p2  ORF type:complete len:63 (-),score=5.06 TRINITY_DN3068_c0_g1_i1:51-239(-)
MQRKEQTAARSHILGELGTLANPPSQKQIKTGEQTIKSKEHGDVPGPPKKVVVVQTPWPIPS